MKRNGWIITGWVGVALLAGCSAQPARIDPTVVSTSYDYTKPVDIAAQSKPVWILPVINKGWIPARVDPKTGDWISGHYQASIVQDGYWATQEEAELSGRPYILAGDSSPIIPSPVSGGPQQGGGGAELDLTAMQRRLGNVEAKQSEMGQTKGQSAELADISAQLQALSQNAPKNTNTMSVPTTQYTGKTQGSVDVQGTPTPMQAAPKPNAANTSGSAPQAQQQADGSSVIVLPSMPAGTAFEIPPSSQWGDKLSVFYLNNKEIEVNYMGQQYTVRLNNPGDKVRISVPANKP